MFHRILPAAVFGAAVLFAPVHSARADALPGAQTCEAPAWLECASGSRAREDVDECTQKELVRLGLRFHCGASHNDRIESYWCRARRLPPPPKAPRAGASESEIEAANAKLAAWDTLRMREFGGIERELTFGTYTEQYLRAMSERLSNRLAGDADPPPPRDPMRLDCFALADKYRRCAIDVERCAPYWKKFAELAKTEFRYDVENRDAFARDAIAAVEGPPDAGTSEASATGTDSGSSTSDAGAPVAPKPSRSCHCTFAPSGVDPSDVALMTAALMTLFARRRLRAVDRAS